MRHFSWRCLWWCFQMRLTWISGLGKADSPPQCGWAPSSPLRAWQTKTWRKRGLVLPARLSWDIGLLLPLDPGLNTISVPGSQTFGPGLDLHTSFPRCPACKQQTAVGLLSLLNYVCWSLLSCVGLPATPGTVACQALLFMRLSRQEYWSEEPFPSPGDLSDPGVEPRSPALQADSLPAEPPGKPRN